MNYVYNHLEKERDRLGSEIQACKDLKTKAELIGNKNLVESAINLLRKCEDFDVKASSIFTKLPEQVCQSPSSDYRIMEDCETENSEHWVEAKVEGRQSNQVRLNQGDVVIEI